MERKLVSFRLPGDLMQDLKEQAEADGVSVTELVCRYSRQGLQAKSDASGVVSTALSDVDTRERIAKLEAKVDHLTRLETRLLDSLFSRQPIFGDS